MRLWGLRSSVFPVYPCGRDVSSWHAAPGNQLKLQGCAVAERHALEAVGMATDRTFSRRQRRRDRVLGDHRRPCVAIMRCSNGMRAGECRAECNHL